MNSKEIENVIKLNSEERYRYFISRIADNEELWSLANEQGWVLSGDSKGTQHVPVWSDAEYAELCATGAWKGTSPKRISLEVWRTRWISGMTKDGRSIAVFPTPVHAGLAVSPQKLDADLCAELDRIE